MFGAHMLVFACWSSRSDLVPCVGVDPNQFQRGESKRVRFNLSRNLFVCYLVAVADRRERLGQKPYWITLIHIILVSDLSGLSRRSLRSICVSAGDFAAGGYLPTHRFCWFWIGVPINCCLRSSVFSILGCSVRPWVTDLLQSRERAKANVHTLDSWYDSWFAWSLCPWRVLDFHAYQREKKTRGRWEEFWSELSCSSRGFPWDRIQDLVLRASCCNFRDLSWLLFLHQFFVSWLFKPRPERYVTQKNKKESGAAIGIVLLGMSWIQVLPIDLLSGRATAAALRALLLIWCYTCCSYSVISELP